MLKADNSMFLNMDFMVTDTAALDENLPSVTVTLKRYTPASRSLIDSCPLIWSTAKPGGAPSREKKWLS